jgi:tetratricopeptide (TPR) repeat protein
MMPRERLAMIALWAALAACGPDRHGGARQAPARDDQRERVVAFWERMNEATSARIAGDCAHARDFYLQALELDAKHEDCLYYLGQCQRELGRPAEARRAFEGLIDVNPGSARGHLALGALLASSNPDEPMDLPLAEKHLRRAHEINGEETGSMVRLGEVLLVEDNAGEARRWFESALRTNPRSVEAAFLAGYIAWEAKDAARARRFAAQAREAAKAQAPVKGVLNEGDRKDERLVAAPPLATPMGRTLFDDKAAFIRHAAKSGEVTGDADFARAWAAVRQARRLYRTRRPFAP